MNNELISETGAYYVETRYTPVTERRGSGIALRMAGDTKIFDWVAFDYEIGNGLEQHRNAVRRACSGTVQFAYETKRGYVFAVTPGNN